MSWFFFGLLNATESSVDFLIWYIVLYELGFIIVEQYSPSLCFSNSKLKRYHNTHILFLPSSLVHSSIHLHTFCGSRAIYYIAKLSFVLPQMWVLTDLCSRWAYYKNSLSYVSLWVHLYAAGCCRDMSCYVIYVLEASIVSRIQWAHK